MGDRTFYTASLYTKSLAFFCPTYPTLVSTVSTLLEALRNYKAYLGEGVPWRKYWKYPVSGTRGSGDS